MNHPVRVLQKLVHVGCRELGIDGETRRDLQLMVTGKESMADMDLTDLEKIVGALKAKGFKPGFKGGSKPGSIRPRRAPAPRADVRFAHVMWKLLFDKGAVKVGGRAGLSAFIRTRFGPSWGSVPLDVDAMTDHRQIADVIEALKAMCVRAGVALR